MRFLTRVLLIPAGGLLVLLLFKLVDWTVYWLWMSELDYAGVFWRLLEVKLLLFAGAFAVVFLYIWINLLILARKLDVAAMVEDAFEQARQAQRVAAGQPWDPAPVASLAGPTGRDRLTTALLAIPPAFLFALAFYSGWDDLVRFVWAEPYGRTDPIYGNDIGFYLFTLPFLRQLQQSVMLLTFLGALLLGMAYIYDGVTRRGERSWAAVLKERGLGHAGANALLFLAAWGLGYYFDRYDLLTDSSGAVYGAGFTDVEVTRRALWAALGLTLLMMAALLWAIRRRRPDRAGFAALGYVAAIFLLVVVVPGLFQRVVVEPNELRREEPFLRHNIAFTREAFGLGDVEERTYGAKEGIRRADIEANRETVDNIRLWDWRPLIETFRQLQRIRAYYEFNDVDIDRYEIDGAIRQVLLSARELSDDLPGEGRNWVNRHLQYTHGYGLAMGLASAKTENGRPVLVVEDLPPQSPVGLDVARPEIYYGESMGEFRIAPSGLEEFDYPRGDQNVYASYEGEGGVPVDSFLRRALFAIHQFDFNILLTQYIGSGSRIQFWRDLRLRIERIAPFLTLDRDPYLALSDGGLYWIQDAYTTSEAFPYSEHYAGPQGRLNYIRNSVKIVVDAYDGDVRFYVMDPEDPVLGVYRSAFPGLFRPLEAMPPGLLAHLRYPQDIFEAQAARYSVYHMTVPQVFYNREDIWEIPMEKYGGEQIDLQPYYILMKLPGGDELQFLLMTPFTPANRDNMIGWMAARGDFPDYGRITVFQLSKETLILGPIQLEAMIDQDTRISRQLSLWDQRGSRVIRGNLLAIPIDNAFLYVEPVYLVAEGTNLPQLKRVIVSDSEKLAMEPTLEAALAVVFGERPREGTPDAAPQAEFLAAPEVRRVFQEARDALEQGRWEAFGRAMDRLQGLLGGGEESSSRVPEDAGEADGAP